MEQDKFGDIIAKIGFHLLSAGDLVDELNEHETAYGRSEGSELKDVVERMDLVAIVLNCAKEVKTAVQKEYDTLRMGIIPDLMDKENVGSVTYDHIGKVIVTSDLRVSIPAHVRDSAYKWLRENGHGGLVKETVNASSLKAMAKDIMLEGSALPDDLFKVSPYSRASITKPIKRHRAAK